MGPAPEIRALGGGVAPGSEPVKAAPTGPLRGPDGLTLTEPDPSAERSLTSAGPKALPKIDQNQRLEPR
jgi:hypothetical protein